MREDRFIVSLCPYVVWNIDIDLVGVINVFDWGWVDP